MSNETIPVPAEPVNADRSDPKYCPAALRICEFYDRGLGHPEDRAQEEKCENGIEARETYTDLPLPPGVCGQVAELHVDSSGEVLND